VIEVTEFTSTHVRVARRGEAFRHLRIATGSARRGLRRLGYFKVATSASVLTARLFRLSAGFDFLWRMGRRDGRPTPTRT
jgi:hypothetical protein